MRVALACCVLLLAPGPGLASGDRMVRLAEASTALFACFSTLAVEARRLRQTEVVYHRAIRVRCAGEIATFATVNAADGSKAARKATEQAIRGALVDAAEDYRHAIAYERRRW